MEREEQMKGRREIPQLKIRSINSISKKELLRQNKKGEKEKKKEEIIDSEIEKMGRRTCRKWREIDELTLQINGSLRPDPSKARKKKEVREEEIEETREKEKQKFFIENSKGLQEIKAEEQDLISQISTPSTSTLCSINASISPEEETKTTQANEIVNKIIHICEKCFNSKNPAVFMAGLKNIEMTILMYQSEMQQHIERIILLLKNRITPKNKHQVESLIQKILQP